MWTSTFHQSWDKQNTILDLILFVLRPQKTSIDLENQYTTASDIKIETSFVISKSQKQNLQVAQMLSGR